MQKHDLAYRINRSNDLGRVILLLLLLLLLVLFILAPSCIGHFQYSFSEMLSITISRLFLVVKELVLKYRYFFENTRRKLVNSHIKKLKLWFPHTLSQPCLINNTNIKYTI